MRQPYQHSTQHNEHRLFYTHTNASFLGITHIGCVAKLLTTNARYKDGTRAGDETSVYLEGARFHSLSNCVAALRNNGTFQRFKSIHTMNELQSIQTWDWIGVAVADIYISFRFSFLRFALGSVHRILMKRVCVCVCATQDRCGSWKYCGDIVNEYPIMVEVTYLLASQLQRTSISIKQRLGWVAFFAIIKQIKCVCFFY